MRWAHLEDAMAGDDRTDREGREGRADVTADHAVVIVAAAPLRRVVGALVEAEGYHVTTLDSAIGAYATIRHSMRLGRSSVALVVLDLELPYRSGLALLGHLKADPATASLPVIALALEPEQLPPARRALAAALLPKPCAPQALQSAVRVVRIETAVRALATHWHAKGARRGTRSLGNIATS